MSTLILYGARWLSALKILDAFAQESESNKISQKPSPNFISDNLDVED